MVHVAWMDTAQLAALERAIEEEDWFTAIVLSATQLERHGYLEIRWHLESLKIDSGLLDILLGRMYLLQIAHCLLALKTIDKIEKKIIEKINGARNEFVHRREETAKDEKISRGAEAKRRYKPLAKEAIRILRKKLPSKRLQIMK